MQANENFLHIDTFRLDQEWEKQPQLYHEYATKLAAAKQEYDEISSEKEVLRSELYIKITKAPGTYNLVDKPTVAAIESAICIDPDYKAICKEEIDAKYTVAIFDAAVRALDHRKRALEKLVELHLSDYYSPPRAPTKPPVDMEQRLIRRGKLKKDQ